MEFDYQPPFHILQDCDCYPEVLTGAAECNAMLSHFAGPQLPRHPRSIRAGTSPFEQTPWGSAPGGQGGVSRNAGVCLSGRARKMGPC